jgi:hypothetical protein
LRVRAAWPKTKIALTLTVIWDTTVKKSRCDYASVPGTGLILSGFNILVYAMPLALQPDTGIHSLDQECTGHR